MALLEWLDNLLDRITMYRFVFYYLLALILAGAIFAAFGFFSFSPVALVISFAIILGTCLLANTAFAKLFKVPVNFESSYITAFILTLIISPPKLAPFDVAGLWFLIAASVFAMASKYLLAIKRKHIFNPAAIAVVFTAFALGQYASWWVGGNLPMLPLLLIGGFLMARKVPRFDLVIAFFVAALASVVATNLAFNPIQTIELTLLHTSVFFFAFIMLTEPATTPPTKPGRIVYGALVGALFSPAIHLGPIYSTPELALVVGNIFSYIVSPKEKYRLALASKTEVAAGIYDFAFAAPDEKNIKFTPGQYLEWTLSPDGADSRGNRRYFTIASSPTEPELHLGVKFYNDTPHGPSAFKKKLLALEPGDTILAGQLAGDFTLPRGFAEGKSATKKLAFIAGGIGITPFRSMVKYLSDAAKENGRRDIVLFYSNRSAAEFAYKDVFENGARVFGLKTVYVTTGAPDAKNANRIDAELIARELPDYHDRIFYLSGPHTMIVAFKKTLHQMGVPRRHVKTDFFPGLG